MRSVSAVLCLVGFARTLDAAPGDQCHAAGPSSGADELSGSTYTWVKDDGGMNPSAGAVVRLDFYGGHADISATSGGGAPVVWDGTYQIAGGKITIKMNGEGIAVDVTAQPYTRSGDELTLPFALTKGTSSRWHRSRQQIVTRVIRAACTALPGAGTKLECSRPGGIGTHSFVKDCLFFDTTLDGALLAHEQQCAASCDVATSKPEGYECEPCILGLENKVAFSNFNALDDKTRTSLAKLYGQIVDNAQPAALARCVAQAKLDAAEGVQKTVLAGNSTHAQEDAASKAVTDARAALHAIKDDPDKRVKIEQQAMDVLLANLIPYQKVCRFDVVPSVKFHFMGEYSAAAQPDTSCDPDDADLTSPTQLVPIAGGQFEQQVFDSLFYTLDKKTGGIHADRYESAAAAMLHEGFHHTQYGCGSGVASSDAARAMILELTEVMTYALSAGLPFYEFALTSDERSIWTEGGRRANARSFAATWTGKRNCKKLGKQIPMDGVATNDHDRREVATFAWAAYPWMKVRMMQSSPDDGGIWPTVCKPQGLASGKPCANLEDGDAIVHKLATARCQ